jgi:hypothetical protein
MMDAVEIKSVPVALLYGLQVSFGKEKKEEALVIDALVVTVF